MQSQIPAPPAYYLPSERPRLASNLPTAANPANNKDLFNGKLVANSRGIVMTIVFTLMATVNAFLELDIFKLGSNLFRKPFLLLVVVILWGTLLVSIISLKKSLIIRIRSPCILMYVSYSILSGYLLFATLNLENRPLYNYLLAMLIAICLAAAYLRGPEADRSWMPFVIQPPIALTAEAAV